MLKFFKYAAMFLLIALLASVVFLGFGLYQAVSTANRYFAGATDYTCRQFVYDIEQEDTDKMLPFILATVAYGQGGTSPTAIEEEFRSNGITPTVRKVYVACKIQPGTRVVNLFATDVTGKPLVATLPVVSQTVPVSSTTTQQEQ